MSKSTQNNSILIAYYCKVLYFGGLKDMLQIFFFFLFFDRNTISHHFVIYEIVLDNSKNHKRWVKLYSFGWKYVLSSTCGFTAPMIHHFILAFLVDGNKKGLARTYAINPFLWWMRLHVCMGGTYHIQVYLSSVQHKYTPSPIDLLLMHLTWLCVYYFRVFETNYGVKLTQNYSKLHTIYGLSCWMNERYSHIR